MEFGAIGCRLVTAERESCEPGVLPANAEPECCPALSRLATVRRTASVQLSELAVNYRGGPIVAEDQGAGLPRSDPG